MIFFLAQLLQRDEMQRYCLLKQKEVQNGECDL